MVSDDKKNERKTNSRFAARFVLYCNVRQLSQTNAVFQDCKIHFLFAFAQKLKNQIAQKSGGLAVHDSCIQGQLFSSDSQLFQVVKCKLYNLTIPAHH